MISLHTLIIKISKIFSSFIPEQDIVEESRENIPVNREPARDYYEDLGNPH
ncbi:MAG: hypothetical protein RLZZ81_5 [Pseudomonadota bacterium]|jgi:hypothetical protein